MSNHTPGPWATKWHESTDSYTIYVKGRSWESWGIAHINYTKEDEHNARLIAAAPELLEALIRCEACTTNDEVGRQARAAIAKATGETT